MKEREEINYAFNREVTYKEVIFNDLISFLIGIFYLFYIAVLLLMFISIIGFGADPPKESMLEVTLGLVLITGIYAIILKFRISSITRLLRNGEIVNAEVLKGLSYEFFVHVVIEYSIHGKVLKKKLLLPNTKLPRKLIDEKNIFLSVDKERHRKVIVRDLYIQKRN